MKTIDVPLYLMKSGKAPESCHVWPPFRGRFWNAFSGNAVSLLSDRVGRIGFTRNRAVFGRLLFLCTRLMTLILLLLRAISEQHI
jgi:hypothetical protein